MLEKILELEIRQVAKEWKINPLNVKKDLLLWITASWLSEVHDWLSNSGNKPPILIWWLSLIKGHFADYPRYTTDVDYSSSRMFYERWWQEDIEYFEKILMDSWIRARDIIVDALWSNHSFEPSIEGLIKCENNTNQIRSLKWNIVVPEFLWIKPIKMLIEVCTWVNLHLIDSEIKPVIQMIRSQASFALYPITVAQLKWIIVSKIWALIERLNYNEDFWKLSRIKDFFDIWYLSQHVSVSESELNFILNNRATLKPSFNQEAIDFVLNKLIKTPEDFLQWIWDLVRINVKWMGLATNEEAFKRMIKWLKINYDIPNSIDMIKLFLAFTNKIRLLPKKF